MTKQPEPKQQAGKKSHRDPETVQAMILGTYHMANPGNDVVNVGADDILAPARQAELDELVDQLASWSPDRVAVELSHDWQAAVEQVYKTYRRGERAYDRVESFPEPFPADFARNEAVQLGFQLADQLDLDSPLAVDYEYRVPKQITEEEMYDAMHGFPTADEVAYPMPEPDTMQAKMNEQITDGTLLEYHKWMNSESQLRENHAMMFGGGLEYEDEEAGIGMLTAWYERNLRTVRTLWERLVADDERVLVVYGSGHVRVLRQLLDEAPMFCSVNPLPYL